MKCTSRGDRRGDLCKRLHGLEARLAVMSKRD